MYSRKFGVRLRGKCGNKRGLGSVSCQTAGFGCWPKRTCHGHQLRLCVQGNQSQLQPELCPHVHCHLILQTLDHDPHTPVDMNAQVVLLEPGEYRVAIQALQQACG